MTGKDRRRGQTKVSFSSPSRSFHLLTHPQFYQEDIVEQISEPGTYGFVLVRRYGRSSLSRD
jgi:hypothetical protein